MVIVGSLQSMRTGISVCMCLEVVQCVKAFDKHLCSEILNLTSYQNLVVRGGAGIKSEVENASAC